ncbi:helix-turn-helix domain-containing protein [Rhodococcus sp. B50]|uniref:helix-turn-helix domain-containing protein n=1 Tax=Rhodococcus sp. B50 TaxID=2682847 RepID=UPI001BD25C06
MLSVEDWARIRRLVADGVPRRQVTRDLGIGRATVDPAVVSDRPAKYARTTGPDIVHTVRGQGAGASAQVSAR